jgi:hypothetical protein
MSVRAPAAANAETSSSERSAGRPLVHALWLFAALAALANAADCAEGPSGSCRATAAGRRILVHVQLEQLFPPELLRLVSLGLTGRVQVEVELVRHRPLWFSRRVARESVELLVSRHPSGEGFLLDGDRLLANADTLSLERIELAFDGDEPEKHEAVVRVQLRVITAASLGKMATWVAGGEGKREERSALSAGVLSLLADELSRTLELSCAVRKR